MPSLFVFVHILLILHVPSLSRSTQTLWSCFWCWYGFLLSLRIQLRTPCTVYSCILSYSKCVLTFTVFWYLYLKLRTGHLQIPNWSSSFHIHLPWEYKANFPLFLLKMTKFPLLRQHQLHHNFFSVVLHNLHPFLFLHSFYCNKFNKYSWNSTFS